MNETLIANINAVVQHNDILYHLGDWSFGRGDTNNAQHYLDQVNCKNIVLITGNHDPHQSNGRAKREFAALFSGGCFDMLRIKVSIGGQKQEIVLNHYAMRVWNKSHHGAFHLWGHSHYSLPDDPQSLSLDVGIDAVAGRSTGKTHQELQNDNSWHMLDPHQYRPISLQEISVLMSIKTFKPIDHHGS